MKGAGPAIEVVDDLPEPAIDILEVAVLRRPNELKIKRRSSR